MAALQWMQWAIQADTQLRVQAGLNFIATSIINEDPITPNHDQRMVAARKLLNGQVNIPDFVKLVAVDEDLRAIIDTPADPTDIELLGAVERMLVVLAKAAL